MPLGVLNPKILISYSDVLLINKIHTGRVFLSSFPSFRWENWTTGSGTKLHCPLPFGSSHTASTPFWEEATAFLAGLDQDTSSNVFLCPDSALMNTHSGSHALVSTKSRFPHVTSVIHFQKNDTHICTDLSLSYLALKCHLLTNTTISSWIKHTHTHTYPNSTLREAIRPQEGWVPPSYASR